MEIGARLCHADEDVPRLRNHRNNPKVWIPGFLCSKDHVELRKYQVPVQADWLDVTATQAGLCLILRGSGSTLPRFGQEVEDSHRVPEQRVASARRCE